MIFPEKGGHCRMKKGGTWYDINDILKEEIVIWRRLRDTGMSWITVKVEKWVCDNTEGSNDLIIGNVCCQLYLTFESLGIFFPWWKLCLLWTLLVYHCGIILTWDQVRGDQHVALISGLVDNKWYTIITWRRVRLLDEEVLPSTHSCSVTSSPVLWVAGFRSQGKNVGSNCPNVDKLPAALLFRHVCGLQCGGPNQWTGTAGRPHAEWPQDRSSNLSAANHCCAMLLRKSPCSFIFFMWKSRTCSSDRQLLCLFHGLHSNWLLTLLTAWWRKMSGDNKDIQPGQHHKPSFTPKQGL